MQFKLLAALLVAGTALAAPQATGTSSSSNDDSGLLDSVPNSILTVIATAIPATWLNDIMNPDSSASIMAEIESGTLPAWYNNLPSSVKAWATSAYGDVFANADASATDSVAAATNTAASVATATGSASAGSTTGSTTGSVESSSAAVSGAVSSATSVAAKATSTAASSAHASATSTGGAPVATGGVAMSIVGAASILGLALAL